RGPLRVVESQGCWAHLDGGNDIGYVTAYRAMGIAISKAEEFGVGLVGVRNATHCGMAGYYVTMAAQRDFVGLMVCDCRPQVVPLGAVEPVLGTNPIAIAVPAPSFPLVLDMSTASITIGDLLMAIQSGKAVDALLAFDANGHPTDDPKAAMKGGVKPFGGHKGYGLALMAQILSGALVGAATIPAPGQDYGYFVLVVDPEIFVPAEQFKRAVSELVERVKTARRAPGVAEILVPGERAFRERERRLKEGIEIDPGLLSELESLAQDNRDPARRSQP
ncbi:MAG: Ldh family oxidoreductase, partial [Planctomycetes bacterium]|nr:Ldh family oxidoreductase [Planctomycetota bacterium]